MTQLPQTEPVQEAHYVYIVRCANDALYTGYARNVLRRVAVHNAGKGGHYTRAHLPVTLLASWSFVTKREALREEYRIKQLTRKQKLQLIAAASIPACILPLEK